jgi:hypothetical protein
VILRQDGVSDFDRLHSRRLDGEVQLLGFDLLEFDGTDLRPEPLDRRKLALARLLRRALWHPASRVPGDIVFAGACRMGLEGIVSKMLSYRPRSDGNLRSLVASGRSATRRRKSAWTERYRAQRAEQAGVALHFMRYRRGGYWSQASSWSARAARLHPQYRRTGHAAALHGWMRAQVQSTRLPMAPGILAPGRWKAKCRLYRRKFTKTGEFFIHTPPYFQCQADLKCARGRVVIRPWMSVVRSD